MCMGSMMPRSDLYDRVDIIPWDKIAAFYDKYSA